MYVKCSPKPSFFFRITPRLLLARENGPGRILKANAKQCSFSLPEKVDLLRFSSASASPRDSKCLEIITSFLCIQQNNSVMAFELFTMHPPLLQRSRACCFEFQGSFMPRLFPKTTKKHD